MCLLGAARDDATPVTAVAKEAILFHELAAVLCSACAYWRTGKPCWQLAGCRIVWVARRKAAASSGIWWSAPDCLRLIAELCTPAGMIFRATLATQPCTSCSSAFAKA